MFIIYAENFIISCSASLFFFNYETNKHPSPLLKSHFLLIRYHIGSIALASLVLGIVKFVKLLMKYATNFVSRMKGGNFNIVWVKTVLKCLTVFVNFSERFVMILSEKGVH